MVRASKKPAETPAALHPFGKPEVIVAKKEDGGKGIPADLMAAKPIEAGYVDPMERSNPEYRAKLAEDEKARLARKEPRKSFGYGMVPQLIGASPNSPQAKTHMLY